MVGGNGVHVLGVRLVVTHCDTGNHRVYLSEKGIGLEPVHP
jgi:hypothetical protein